MTPWAVIKKWPVNIRSQAKHERNFMAELLDEFLASLEEFGERELAVEDTFGGFLWDMAMICNDHMIDMQINVGEAIINLPPFDGLYMFVPSMLWLQNSGWFTIALVTWHHVGTMWIFSKSSTQTDADPQELSYLERLWSYLSKQLWRFEKNPPVIIQMCTWQFPVCSWFCSWFSHQNLHLWYHLLGIAHCHVLITGGY